MKIIRYIFLFVVLLLGFAVCKEGQRYEVFSDDKMPPGRPVLKKEYKPLYGGARLYFEAPDDEDLMTIDAEYTNETGKTFRFSTSYFKDSLDVLGWGDMKEHELSLFAVDRAGNRSKPLTLKCTPLEPVVTRVAFSLKAMPAFGSFFVDWKNELEEEINVYVEFMFTEKGEKRSLLSIYTSILPEERVYLRDMQPDSGTKIEVQVRVEDTYGNMTDPVDFGDFELLADEFIPKDNWFLPAANDSIGGVPMAFGDGYEGRMAKVIDGIIDYWNNLNFSNAEYRGRTGKPEDGNVPYNIMIDLGDYYELSRIVTVQRHVGDKENRDPGWYYGGENIGVYNMYRWDDDLNGWVFLSQHKIPKPQGKTAFEIIKMGEAGDEALIYPDDPRFCKKTRWFRYEALYGFGNDYKSTGNLCLSEITLYGRKTTQ